MNKNLLFLAALAVFASCKKSTTPEPEPPAPETIKEIKFEVKELKAPSSAPVKQGNGNYSFVGYGYDVTGKYADTSSVKAPVFDVMAYVAAYPQRIDIGRSTSGGFNTLYAKNAEDYLTQISDKFNKGNARNLFKKTLTTAFPAGDAVLNNYIYARYEYGIMWRTVRTYWSDFGAKDYLTAAFKNDVQNLTPEKLVQKYGTHILSQIILGAKFNVYYQAKTADNRKQHSAIVGFTYALNKFFATPSGYLDPLKPADVNAISEPKMVYEVTGGDPSKVTIKETTKGNIVWFYDWVSTCTEDKIVFTDIMSNGIIPLYDMIDETAKKAEVKAYIDAYIEQNQVKL